MKSWSYSVKEVADLLGVDDYLVYDLSKKIKRKRLLSITGNEYQKNFFRTGIKASPGIG